MTPLIKFSPPIEKGMFGAVRKYDIHNGIDLYCEEGSDVYSIEDGEVINVCPFTGEIANSPWWENTYAILILGKSGVILYGELLSIVKIGDKIKECQKIGKIKTVLKQDKGNGKSMLHLELYEKDYFGDGVTWELNSNQPEKLKDPTPLLKGKL